MKLKKIKVPATNSNGDIPMSMSMSMLPSFHADETIIPEIKNWKVGGKYELVIEVEQKMQSEVTINGVSKIEGRFDIVAYKFLPKKSIEEMTDIEFSEYQNEMKRNQKTHEY
ncbi:hypothetical protein HY469_02205 [Candidatus Roizmanbacteria bacterium]|nr:hypothetical protein [Candidatus Roizmanbacteria bacterium]